MTIRPIADLDGLKIRIRATWMAGDYSSVASLTESAANDFIDRRRIKPSMQVLDVACGNGNLSIPAAKAGAAVTGVNISPNLLDQARARATREKLNVRFEEGDAENLPVAAAAFDLVVSMFGAIFAPRPELVAAELRRVCRSGGQIAMANWTPSGFIGAVFRTTAKHVASPASVPSPLQWGDEAIIRERLGAGVSDLQMTRRSVRLKFPFSIPETVEYYRVHYGPTLKAFAGLSETAQAALRRDLEDLYAEHNNARDGTTCIAAEYLEVVGTRT
jgi:2-polyprenyl-3-methyl-5-hydroxy-6-metoxy-1,4-benzoquinol methylase